MKWQDRLENVIKLYRDEAEKNIIKKEANLRKNYELHARK